jgi:hypothetical protein
MAQQPLEMIPVRQLAGYLFVPVLVVDNGEAGRIAPRGGRPAGRAE